MSNIDNLDNGKFIVINKKRLSELNAKHFSGFFGGHQSCFRLELAISDFITDYETSVNKKMDQKYIVCNQDEPYAEEVARIILEGEAAKEQTHAR